MLPPLPSFLPARPADTLALEPAEPPASLIPTIEAGPSASSSMCAMCTHTAAKYTCPRCDLRTCSAPCSKAHKVQTGCNGQRDPTKFVTLNRFTQGDWGGDYAYLEKGRRQVADWGKALPPAQPGHGQGHGNTHSRRRGGGGGHHPHSPKVEGLRRELERRGVEVEFMPEGMGRRKMNQSSWNHRTQSLHLTVQLSFRQGQGTEPKVVNHLRVPYDSAQHTLAHLLPSSSDSGGATAISDSVLVLPFHPSTNHPTPIDILLREPRPKLFFPPLALDTTLQQAFRGMSWVEFPTIHVISRAEWEAAMGRGEVAIVQPAPPPQHRGEKRTSPPSQQAEQNQAAEVAMEIGKESKRPRMDNGSLALADYASEEDDGEAAEADLDLLEEPEGEPEEEEEITEQDIQVMQALGAAAAADMA